LLLVLDQLAKIIFSVIRSPIKILKIILYIIGVLYCTKFLSKGGLIVLRMIAMLYPASRAHLWTKQNNYTSFTVPLKSLSGGVYFKLLQRKIELA